MLRKGPKCVERISHFTASPNEKANTATRVTTRNQLPKHTTTMPAIPAATETAMQPAAATIATTDVDDDVLALLDLSNIKRKKSKKVRLP